jgi:glycosyltransferase involved in cell wall biosynthesis
MILGIDASNIRAGGGLTHLAELLRAADPLAHGFSKVVVWSGASTLARIESKSWLVKCHDAILDRGLAWRVYWQRFRLKPLLYEAGCHLLFVPGGTDASGFQPMVTMNQNLLPFEWRELLRYGWSPMTFKFALLRLTQSRTYRRAKGIIFLSEYAEHAVGSVLGSNTAITAIIPHGVHQRFEAAPRVARPIESYTASKPLRLLYVSIVDVYKHQWHVATAVARLRAAGTPVALDLVGPPGAGMRRLQRTLAQVDPRAEVIQYHGAVAHETLADLYRRADGAVFASSCETFGQILLEAMAAGLPIACSNRSAMPEVLGEAGLYFDPESPEQIATVLLRLVESAQLRSELAMAAYQRARRYSWTECARQTFEFIAGCR